MCVCYKRPNFTFIISLLLFFFFLLQQQVKEHIEKDCPKAKISCPFSDMGCDYKVCFFVCLYICLQKRVRVSQSYASCDVTLLHVARRAWLLVSSMTCNPNCMHYLRIDDYTEFEMPVPCKINCVYEAKFSNHFYGFFRLRNSHVSGKLIPHTSGYCYC